MNYKELYQKMYDDLTDAKREKVDSNYKARAEFEDSVTHAHADEQDHMYEMMKDSKIK